MASRKQLLYQRGRTFKLTGSEVIELIFADDSGDEIDTLDDDDLQFLESIADQNLDSAIIQCDTPTTELLQTENSEDIHEVSVSNEITHEEQEVSFKKQTRTKKGILCIFVFL